MENLFPVNQATLQIEYFIGTTTIATPIIMRVKVFSVCPVCGLIEVEGIGKNGEHLYYQSGYIKLDPEQKRKLTRKVCFSPECREKSQSQKH